MTDVGRLSVRSHLNECSFPATLSDPQSSGAWIQFHPDDKMLKTPPKQTVNENEDYSQVMFYNNAED